MAYLHKFEKSCLPIVLFLLLLYSARNTRINVSSATRQQTESTESLERKTEYSFLSSPALFTVTQPSDNGLILAIVYRNTSANGIAVFIVSFSLNPHRRHRSTRRNTLSVGTFVL